MTAHAGVRKRVGGVLGLLLAAGVAACDAPTLAPRTDLYDVTSSGFAGVIVHWPVSSTIRVHAVDDDAASGLLPSALARGATAWNGAVLFGEYRLVGVEEPGEADVVLAWSDATLPVDTSDCSPRLSGTAVTTFCIDEAEDDLRCLDQAESDLLCYPLLPGVAPGPGTVRMVVLISAGLRQEEVRVGRIVAHELGHVLGILTHSSQASDLMFADPQTAVPARRDRAAVQVLYHTPADIVP